MRQPMPNPEDITYPTTAMNMALVLMAKAFKLNYSTPTNNNQRISSNPHNRQIAQPGMNMGQDRQMQMVGGNGGNQFRQYAGQNVGNQNGYNAVQNVRNQVVQNAVQNQGVQNVGNQNGQIVVPGITNQNPNGNGNVVAARAEGNATGNNGNQIRCYNCRGLGHLARNCTVRPRRRDAAYLQTQLLIAQKEEAGIQLQAEEFDLMAAAADLDEIEEVNANCILMANLQQASTSGTQTDKAPVYDSDGSAEVHNYDNCYDNEIFNMFTQEEQYTELLEPIPEPHQVQQNDSNVISDISSVEQEGGTVDQHPATVEETRAYFESLYNNLALEVEKVNSVNRKMKETNADLTTELARYKNQEKCFEISQEKYDKLERCYQKSVYQEQCLTKKINALHLSSGKQITTLNEEISNLSKQLSTEKSTVSSLLEEKKKLKSDFKIREDELLDKQIQLENKIKELDNILVKMEASKFVQDFKSLAKEADESLAKHKSLELEIKRLFRAVVSQDIMSIVQSNSIVDTSNLQTELDRIKRRFENSYNDTQQKIERLQAQLGDKKGKSKDTPCVSNTLDPLSQKLENENVSEQKDTTKGTSVNTQFCRQSILGKPSSFSGSKLYVVTPFPKSKGLPKIDETHALINPFKPSREEKYVPNKVRANIRTNPITVSQPHVITKKDVNSDSNGLSSTGVDDNIKYLILFSEIQDDDSEEDQEEDGDDEDTFDMWDIMVEDVERIRKFFNVPNEIDEIVQPLIPEPIDTTPPNDDYVAPTTKSILDELLEELRDEILNITMVDDEADFNPTKDLEELERLLAKEPQTNFMKIQFLGTVRFGNDHVAAILDFVDLLKGNRTTNLYTISLHEMASASPIFLMARATSTKSWLWHQCLSHLNFDTINDLAKNDLVTGLPKFKYHKERLCPSCEQGKSKRRSHPPKPVPNSKQRLHLLHMDLCGPMRI
ncbi:integrase, catalytic region, zinc finger, CCHC-type containing protein [Tanacetum coccineum]|uniref:Integrase, catalytic region, zinc finger, CCHC-type containing protein n=1 Tax=Tanacetum coccineum TaxID=301880 RepID=A0ABQ5ID78_9ASTR